MGRILIIEDSESTRSTYAETLTRDHTLKFATTMQEGIAAGTSEVFDLILIDLTLPDGDGFELCRRLVQHWGSQIPPFLFVSGRYDIQDKLTGFAMGAEDYIVKPFDPQELQARVDIRLRRHPSVETIGHVAKRFGLVIDEKSLRALAQDDGQTRDLNLTPNEYRLLCVLITNAGKTFSRSELLEAGWGSDVHVLERTVDRHISSLRRKLGQAHMHLEAVPGSGYRWAKNP
ncbi:MAG TPA: response regulator transcription factor [Oligoflexus sp.]|uniref:response regulator transcription factor n=1 Tax=Oligoflexus sp. TaxID=1971216 RepID=UPI002D6501C9|nr:response regulator transcription factor [Oligoflexus sp.]HYX38842.1 response regulator transcription factor [Oligoflexus sp.]